MVLTVPGRMGEGHHRDRKNLLRKPRHVFVTFMARKWS